MPTTLCSLKMTDIQLKQMVRQEEILKFNKHSLIITLGVIISKGLEALCDLPLTLLLYLFIYLFCHY